MVLFSGCGNSAGTKEQDTQPKDKSTSFFSKIKSDAKDKVDNLMDSTEDTSEQKNSKIEVNDKVRKHVDGEFKNVLAAIQTKKKESLYELFSVDGQMQGQNFDDGERYVFDLLKGNVVKWKADVMEKSIIHASFTEIYAWYTIETDQGTYKLFLSTYTKNEVAKKDVGLYALRLIKKDDANFDFTVPESMDIPGIYFPDKADDTEKE